MDTPRAKPDSLIRDRSLLTPEAQLYCNCLVDVRRRIDLVDQVVAGKISVGTEDFDGELIFLNLRKTLEQITFSTLVAHKEEYAAVYENFSEHWRATKMLGVVESVNPNFYPVPLELPIVGANGVKTCLLVEDPYLTREDFVFLYDISAEVLHVRNPFSRKPKHIHIQYSVSQWTARIRRLLAVHMIDFPDGSKWVGTVPRHGPVHVVSAAAVPVPSQLAQPVHV
jgi:hypothetical protein